jgi:tetratricopeptide (TPR) repeat protein
MDDKGDVISARDITSRPRELIPMYYTPDPSDGVAAAKRGYAFLNAGQYPEAIASYDRALPRDPENSGVLSNRSLAKQLASGITRATLSAAGPDVTVVPDSGRKSTSGTLPASTTVTAQHPLTQVPGTTKAPASLPLLLLE